MMTKDEVAQLISTMPDNMSADDYIMEVVKRAMYMERCNCMGYLRSHVQGMDRQWREFGNELADELGAKK